MSEQGHLLVATALEVAHLGQDALEVAAALTAAGVGHDAIVAEIVATAHDAYETAQVAATDALGHDVAIGFREREFGVDGLVTEFGLRHEVGEGEISVGASHEVAVVVVEEALLDALCHTAEHTNDEAATLLAEGVKGFEAVDDFLFGVVAHGAGVEEDGIGLVEVVARFVVCHTHDGGHHFAVGHVHLATVGFYVEFLHYGWICLLAQSY